MAFIETRFPTDIAYGSAGGPEYSTDIVITNSGYEQRNANWSQSRARYNVAHGIKTQAQLDALIAFFRARKGRADGFRFKDWSDYQTTGEAIAAGDGVTTVFQLTKAYASGTTSESRSISKPVAGTVNIYLAAVLQNSGYTLDTTTGLVTFTAAPGSGVAITADFQFDVPVRFDTDRLAATLDSYSSYSWQDIPLVEIRV
ncbi:MAG: DUF2460 domain-containing protein [Pseudomonadota bacterium]|nr:DUF2460 domain-containing protein [Pseudomonadota bacterium]MDE3037129.1 DUF2460 domain-containing protein [Pseudomonadota bacterium]